MILLREKLSAEPCILVLSRIKVVGWYILVCSLWLGWVVVFWFFLVEYSYIFLPQEIVK